MKPLQFTSTTHLAKILMTSLVCIIGLVFSSIEAQERTVKGTITNDDGPVESVNIILKGTRIGTTTNADGKFTFPRALKAGDVLLVSYLGYEIQRITINKETQTVTLVLTEDMIDMTGDVATDKLYSSKRRH